MNANFAALAYLLSGVLFIMALRGLSSPETSRKGNTYGMIGMVIAVATTLAAAKLDQLTLTFIGAGVLVGGTIGAILARSIKMTAMPQLVAAFHSLIGLAAVAVAAAAFYAPDAFGIAATSGGIKMGSLIELSLGVAIGAVTFTGSVIAFAKLNGNMSGAPIMLPARHLINILIAAGIVALIVYMIGDHGLQVWPFWAIVAASLLIGILLIIPIGGADMPVVVSMLNSYS
jgi:NAD(P) transhydrogenase subunit beta